MVGERALIIAMDHISEMIAGLGMARTADHTTIALIKYNEKLGGLEITHISMDEFYEKPDNDYLDVDFSKLELEALATINKSIKFEPMDIDIPPAPRMDRVQHTHPKSFKEARRSSRGRKR